MAYLLLPNAPFKRQPGSGRSFEYEVNNQSPFAKDLEWARCATDVRSVNGSVINGVFYANAGLSTTLVGAQADRVRKGTLITQMHRVGSAFSASTPILLAGRYWNVSTSSESVSIGEYTVNQYLSQAIQVDTDYVYYEDSISNYFPPNAALSHVVTWDASIAAPTATWRRGNTSFTIRLQGGPGPWTAGNYRGFIVGSENHKILPSHALLYSRTLSIDEQRELQRMPWQVWRPKVRRSYHFAPTSSAAALAGAAQAQASAAASLTIPLTGAAAVVATAAGALSTAIPLAGLAAAVSVASGVLTAQITLSGSALAQAAASASLTTQISLSGAAIAQALAAASLTAQSSGLAGAAAAQASASGALLTQIPLAGAAQANSTAAGGLTTLIALTGVAASVSAATGNLMIEFSLTGAALAQVAANGNLTTQIRLSGAALAQAAASGSLSSGPSASAKVYAVRALARDWSVSAPRRSWRIRVIARNWRISA